MHVEQLIVSLKDVSELLLPTLGAAVLLFLIFFIRKCSAFVIEATKRIQQLETTVNDINLSLDKAQAPLDTVVKYSDSLDKFHDSATDAMHQASQYVVNKVEDLKSHLKKEDTVQEVTVLNNEGEEIHE